MADFNSKRQERLVQRRLDSQQPSTPTSQDAPQDNFASQDTSANQDIPADQDALPNTPANETILPRTTHTQAIESMATILRVRCSLA